ncbi:MAG: adenosylmethionine--8-amino-7-oxononanoate transaminase, partial [Deltaproteobacteria bacterium]|nr:adenosylmethionine--8-amino-7-oxononanoate transaminase [Deltaproteobacteria bacterium]
GYNHPALMAALRNQAAAMPHVMFGGLTHNPAVVLAEKLLGMAPRGLEHVFFADSGSVSVEVALKMALQYQMAAGNAQKNRFLALKGGYHGDTLGAMSVCDPENGMHHLFSGILPAQHFAPRPECRFDAPYDPASFAAFEAELVANADRLAAVILEPIVQGAGGMWFYHPGFLRDVKIACERYGCLLILDEIATGFGRTGKLFACEHAGIEPDILCLGKGLTGGVMTLAATLATRNVAEGVSQNGNVLMHGPTFMANPLACAVAGASLSILATGAWRADVARIETTLRQGLLPCANLTGVRDARVLGAIGVLEMEEAVDMAKLHRYFVESGVWLRPFGHLIYVMPPYTATDAEIETLTRAMRGAVESGAWR